ncbi:hypothetical protein EST38_g4879 [Candolleomyces aberdarensis]|uniref:Uncharacterized protein n=1 Tax=Candolleomyces aberdarensis TaxID=2316362 RepID=A0A4Q2DQ34_9AGAR|nr:hypothetical protein EST38_g4879 [Candolleomyces aberdarensis]
MLSLIHSNIKLLPIAQLCYDFLLKMFGAELGARGIQAILGYDTFLWIASGLNKTELKQDIIFTALLFLRRLVHFHGPSLGPLGGTPIRLIFLTALSVANSVLDDYPISVTWWVEIFKYFDEMITEPGERLEDAKEQLRTAREMFCEAIFYDLIPHSREFFNPFKAALVAHFEGQSAGNYIKDVTSRCIFRGYEKPELASYECKCGRIEAPLSSYYGIPDGEMRAEEVKVMFPKQGGAKAAFGVCGIRVKDTGIEE